MYDALGVKDVDKILNEPSSEEPVPKDPAQEHIDALDNVDLKAFEGQNHDAHIMAHLTFSASPIAMQSPQILISLQKHVTEHVKIKAEEIAFVEYRSQVGDQPPNDDQMLQIEMRIAEIIAEELQKVRKTSQQIAGAGQPQQGPDPLVALKEKELAIREQETQADIANDMAKLELEQEKVMQRDRQFNRRIESQEDLTMARLQAQDRRELIKNRGQ